MSTSYFLKTKGKHITVLIKNLNGMLYIHRQNIKDSNTSAPIASMDSPGKTF